MLLRNNIIYQLSVTENIHVNYATRSTDIDKLYFQFLLLLKQYDTTVKFLFKSQFTMDTLIHVDLRVRPWSAYFRSTFTSVHVLKNVLDGFFFTIVSRWPLILSVEIGVTIITVWPNAFFWPQNCNTEWGVLCSECHGTSVKDATFTKGS